MYDKMKQILQDDLAAMRANGTFKTERIISSKQGREITVNGKQVLNFVPIIILDFLELI